MFPLVGFKRNSSLLETFLVFPGALTKWKVLSYMLAISCSFFTSRRGRNQNAGPACNFLGVDSPLLSTIVLFKNQLFPSCLFFFFLRKKDAWKEWKWKLPLDFFAMFKATCRILRCSRPLSALLRVAMAASCGALS